MKKSSVKITPETQEFEEEEEEIDEEWEGDENEKALEDLEQTLLDMLRGKLSEEDLDDEDFLDQEGTIPEYMLLKTPEEQRKYFEKLNKEYYKNLEKAEEMTRNHNRKVNFHLNKITVKGNIFLA